MKKVLIGVAVVVAIGVAGLFANNVYRGQNVAKAPALGTLRFVDTGVAITPPQDWHIMSAGEFTRMMQDFDTGSSEIDRRMRSADPSLPVTVARDSVSRGVNPAISLNYHRGRIEDLAEAFDRVIALLEQTSDFELIQPPLPDQLGPFDAQFMRYRYTALSSGIRLSLQETLWLVPMGDHYLTVSTGADVDEDPAIFELLREAAHSLERTE